MECQSHAYDIASFLDQEACSWAPAWTYKVINSNIKYHWKKDKENEKQEEDIHTN